MVLVMSRKYSDALRPRGKIQDYGSLAIALSSLIKLSTSSLKLLPELCTEKIVGIVGNRPNMCP